MLTSKDDRLKGVLINANSCCTNFARMPKEVKDIFIESLTLYNFFYDINNLNDLEIDVSSKLLELLKFVGNNNTIGAKKSYIASHWFEVKQLAHEYARARVG
jgi:hypothetical protein